MHLSSLSSLFVALLLVVFLPSQQPTEARSLNNQADQQELISIISGLTDQALSRSSHVDSSPASVSSSSSASSYDDNNSNNNEDVVKDESALSENEEQSAISLMNKEFLLRKMLDELKTNLARVKAQRLLKDSRIKPNHFKRAACGNLNGNPMYKWICW